MKLLITTLAGTALISLAACNQADAGNSADNATEAAANEAAPDANAADANAAKPEGNEVVPLEGEAAPGGDKPAEDNATDPTEAGGDKPE